MTRPEPPITRVLRQLRGLAPNAVGVYELAPGQLIRVSRFGSAHRRVLVQVNADGQLFGAPIAVQVPFDDQHAWEVQRGPLQLGTAHQLDAALSIALGEFAAAMTQDQVNALVNRTAVQHGMDGDWD